MKSGIYRIRNTLNEKFYIGSTNDFERREKEHFSDLLRGNHRCGHLQRAYNKEPDKFVFVFEYPLLVCSDDRVTLCLYEQQFLDFYKASGRLYNTSKSAAHPEATPEMRKKLSEKCRGEGNGRSKLTENDVLYIRASTESHVELAKQFSVSPMVIGDIRARHSWKHLDGPIATAQHGRKKLTEANVLYIRASTELGVVLAEKFNIAPTTVSAIRNRKRQKHVA